MSEQDKSPRAANRAEGPGRAEISNFDIVDHYFTLAADRLEVPDDVRAVLSSSYREVQVQTPVRLGDGKTHVFSGYRVQHNGAPGADGEGRHAHARGRLRSGDRARPRGRAATRGYLTDERVPTSN